MKRRFIKKLLIFLTSIFLLSKGISFIWWKYYAYYWDTPFYKIIEFLDKICSASVFFILCIFWIIYLFSSNETSNNNDTIQKSNEKNENEIKKSSSEISLKKGLFIICLFILGSMIVRILLSPINGYHCSICGFTGGGGETTYYGIEALEMSLLFNFLMFLVIPIYPISLIYVVVYIFKNKNQD